MPAPPPILSPLATPPDTFTRKLSFVAVAFNSLPTFNTALFIAVLTADLSLKTSTVAAKEAEKFLDELVLSPVNTLATPVANCVALPVCPSEFSAPSRFGLLFSNKF